ncbi:MAG: SH3 domain-containing protein [Eubacterium sp.]|nr:SH3 domain-containing protein [Eubacterium sp.]
MPYDEETRRLIENRKRNAEFRKEQQMKKRKMTLAGLGGVIALLVVFIIIAASCSAKKDTEVETNPIKETSVLGVTTAEETTVSESTSASETGTTNQHESVSNNDNVTSVMGQGETTSPAATGSDSGIQYTKDVVNIRRKADGDSEIIEVLEKNEKVEVLGVEGKWTYVKWGDIKGYISTEYLKNEQ